MPRATTIPLPTISSGAVIERAAVANDRNVLLSVQGICKSYAGVPVLQDISFELSSGQGLGLLGQNGAGKSTLIKILSGVERPSSGTLLLDGQPVHFRNSADAQRAGIATIHQEIHVVPHMSVAENLCISDIPHRGPIIDRHEAALASQSLLRSLGFNLDVWAPANSLSAAEKQVVLIAKSLRQKARVLLLDEPTATLPAPDVTKLLDLLRALKANGTAIVYISHRIDEAYDICEDLVVLRDGRRVLSGTTQDTPKLTAVRTMVADTSDPIARESGTLLDPAEEWNFNRRSPLPATVRKVPALETISLSDGAMINDVSLHVANGEAVAVTGLVGSGLSQLAACLSGDRKVTSGEVRVNGASVLGQRTRQRIAAGIGWVPEDRKSQGLVLEMDVSRNMSMASLQTIAISGLLQGGKERRNSLDLISRLRIRGGGPEATVGTLSGGNQQKVVVGKWLLAHSKILLLSEPTRGIDVRARGDIYREINSFLALGGAVIVFSSELEEAFMCHRVYVMAHGSIAGEFDASSLDEADVMSLMR
jgi:ribose transport system ATP-binding protein